MKTIHLALSAMLSLAATNVYADTVTAQKLADKYAAAAKKADSSYAGLSVDEG
jgi:hypothetical protein